MPILIKIRIKHLTSERTVLSNRGGVNLYCEWLIYWLMIGHVQQTWNVRRLRVCVIDERNPENDVKWDIHGSNYVSERW